METSFEYNMAVKKNADKLIALYSIALTVLTGIGAYGWAYYSL